MPLALVGRSSRPPLLSCPRWTACRGRCICDCDCATGSPNACPCSPLPSPVPNAFLSPSLTPSCQSTTAFARNLAVLRIFPLASRLTSAHPRRVGSTSTIPPGSCATGSPKACPCSPPPESIPLLLAQLTDSSLSLAAIAKSHGLTLTDLTTLMARPDIAEQLAAIHAAAAQRTRIVAAQHLPLAVEVLASIAATHRDEDSPPGFDPANPRHRILRLRHRESARRAASTLLRLANYAPRPPALVGRTSCPPAPVAPPSHSPAQVGRTSCPPALTTPSHAHSSHAHDEVGSATESWRCPAPALTASSRANEVRGSASSSVPIHAPLPASGLAPSQPLAARGSPVSITLPLRHSATSPLPSSLLSASGTTRAHGDP